MQVPCQVSKKASANGSFSPCSLLLPTLYYCHFQHHVTFGLQHEVNLTVLLMFILLSLYHYATYHTMFCYPMRLSYLAILSSLSFLSLLTPHQPVCLWHYVNCVFIISGRMAGGGPLAWGIPNTPTQDFQLTKTLYDI